MEKSYFKNGRRLTKKKKYKLSQMENGILDSRPFAETPIKPIQGKEQASNGLTLEADEEVWEYQTNYA